MAKLYTSRTIEPRFERSKISQDYLLLNNNK